jgi:hypothetical protein
MAAPPSRASATAAAKTAVSTSSMAGSGNHITAAAYAWLSGRWR